MSTDLNKIKKADADKWEGIADVLRFGTLGLLIGSIFVLEAMPSEMARVYVWYIASGLLLLATAGFIAGNISIKKTSEYFSSESKRIAGIFEEAIKESRKKKT